MLFDTFYCQESRLILAAGNNMTPDASFDSLPRSRIKRWTTSSRIGKQA